MKKLCGPAILGSALLVTLCPSVQNVRAAEPRAADYWLDRAVAELPAIRARREPAPQISLNPRLTEEVAVLMLKEARGSNAERDRLIELARHNEAKPPAVDQPAGPVRHVLVAAQLYAGAGAADEVRRLLPAIKAALERMPKGLEKWGTTFAVTQLRAQVGDLTDAEAIQLSPSELAGVVAELEQQGAVDQARRYAALARQAGAPVTQPSGDASSDKSQVRRLVRGGDVAAARRLADAMPHEEFHWPEALGEIARGQRGTGDVPAYQKSMRDALGAARTLKQFDRSIALATLLGVAEEAGDRATLSEAADALSACIAADAPLNDADRTRLEAKTAFAYAAVGRQDAYLKAVARTEASLAGQLPEDQASGWLRIANAKARALDKVGAAAAVERSKAAFPLERWDWADRYQLPDAYLAAGDLQAAVAAVRTGLDEPDDRRWPLRRIAVVHVRAGRFDAGQKVADEIADARMRFLVHRFILVERVKAGRLEGLAAWIDAHDTPHERAFLNLAAGQQLVGLEGRGSTREFRIEN